MRLCFCSPPAGQANLTIGNDLTLTPSPTASLCEIATPPCTLSTTGNHTGNFFEASSPVNGVVQSFGIKTSGSETVTFRLTRFHFHPMTATGAGTGPTAKIPGAGVTSVPASLPIEAGDYLGIDTSSTTAFADSNCFMSGGGFLSFHPTLTDGAPFVGAIAASSCDLLVNAVVRPENRFTIRGLSLDRHRGTAIQKFVVTNPGRISVSGQDIKPDAANVDAAGAATLDIAASGDKKRTLKNRGAVTLNPTFAFKPMGGTASQKSDTVTLKLR